ncbi:unnamed protein product [Candidula unifasciata]|uniref:Threonine synthase-like 2 n=1 Tax=Candidula unifasciata TaxID=100452 RepID=A0A8S3YIR5_9EUPU|nr:unnamed protein product [Candidula unifasciata]
MKYHSTRGGVTGVSFKDVVLSGYASDRGMFLPETFPRVPVDTLKTWADLSYVELAYEICSLYISDQDIPSSDLKGILEKSFSTFSIPEVVHIAELSEGLNISELYHGRSLAFKDLAMSCMGNFYNYFLSQSRQHMTLLVCTSGDTGSSAIEAVRGFEFVDIIVILPRGRCTEIQERQMTTVLDKNVHVYRADGTSDDIDVTVRELFDDTAYVKKHHLASPSSLNFGRIVIQIVHFFFTYLKLCPNVHEEVEVIIPTGAGGNVTAGLIARTMGLPVRFVCAVNHNNVMSHMMETGKCQFGSIQVTLSPAMDIQFGYNLERIWHMCSNGDSATVKEIMSQVDQNEVNIPPSILNAMKSAIEVYVVSGDEEIKATIRRCWTENEYNICPHTAVGVSYWYSQHDRGLTNGVPSVVLATASPLKFPEAIKASGVPVPASDNIQSLFSKPTHYVDLELGQNWTEIIKAKIENITASLKQAV